MTKICHLLSIIHKINKNQACTTMNYGLNFNNLEMNNCHQNQACTTMNYGLNFNNSEMNNCHQLYRLSIKKMEL
jgi:hypothetical protein